MPTAQHQASKLIWRNPTCSFLVNTPPQHRELMKRSLVVREVENPGSYLGLPILWGPSKQNALAYVGNKVGKKVLGWQKRCLSFAGREVMIKVVINVVPIYSMSCFKFRTETCKEFDRMVSNFFWSNTTSASGIHWRAWQSLTRAKQEGGLGFKDFMG